jgi:glycosyltransferase involved in cell wall biosynthesis
MSTALSPAQVAVVIPHFNRSDLLKETLRSVQRQTMGDWEVIVVDDGSSPEEYRHVQAMATDRILVIQRTDGLKGPSRCRNLGWQAATAPLVIFLDSDDLLAPWCLESRLSAAKKDSDAGAWVFPVMLFRNQPGDLNRLWNQLGGDDDIPRFLVSDPPWHTSSPLWRKDVLADIGGFNECVIYGDDADLHLRALYRSVWFAKHPQALPDIFVRRAENPRITNTISDTLLQSRLIRLTEGTRVVRAYGTPAHKLAWQGQYFVECEFLLFRLPSNPERLHVTMEAWHQDWPSLQVTRLICWTYLVFASFVRRRAYILLRIARRLAMLCLPGVFFPRGGRFEAEQLSESDLSNLRQRLHESTCDLILRM